MSARRSLWYYLRWVVLGISIGVGIVGVLLISGLVS